MALDFEALLRPIDDSAPCGEELRYDPGFATLQSDIKPKIDYQMVNGEEVAVPQQRDWPKIRRDALALCDKGRDLRLIVLLIRAAIGVDGVVGIGHGLHLLRASLEQYWPTIHPELDTDETDPAEQAMLRLNAYRQLADKEGILDELRRAMIVEARGVGGVTLRAIQIVEGRVQAAPGEEPPDGALIEAVFKSVEAETLQEVRTALSGAITDLKSIDEFLGEQVGGPEYVPSISPLEELLANLLSQVSSRMEGEASEGEEETGMDAGDSAVTGAAPAAKASAPARIETRDDVVKTLDRLLDYYSRREPSSPIPLLLERVKRLVPMSFLDLMQDLAPDGIEQLHAIGGITDEEE